MNITYKKTYFFITSLVILLLIFSIIIYKAIPDEDYNKGLHYYKTGQPSDAFKHMLISANNGYTHSQVMVAEFYATGNGTNTNRIKALKYLKKLSVDKANDSLAAIIFYYKEENNKNELIYWNNIKNEINN